MEPLRHALLSALDYLSEADREVVARAFDRAVEWHDGQTRDSGEPYVTHPIAVAQYLASLEAERDTLVAALLHDVVEDNRIDLPTVQAEFGEEVSKLVDGVTKLTKMHYEGDRTARQMASLRKLLLMASDDLRVILIKLADRWHNIETLSSLRPDKRQRVAYETLDIYVPFARIVGLWELKRRFEEICFPAVFPEEASLWHERVAELRSKLQPERSDFVQHINAITAREVTGTLSLMTDYELREKLYGDLDRLNETHQVDSVLLIIAGTATPTDCYQLLGEVHQRYPVRGLSFRDYINAPSPNGYRGLHTTIFLSKNHQLRLRIQTEEMYDYVSKRKISSWINEKTNDIYTALASLNQTSYDKDRFLQDVKGSVLERMNVFTTAGEIITLPRGATGIDFAFVVNPGYVASMAGIRVNGEVQEATFELHDGDTAELILLEKGPSATRALWVEKVKSVAAREALKQSLSLLPEQKKREEGKLLLQLEARKRRLPIWWLLHWAGTQQDLALSLEQPDFEILLERVGTGELSVRKVMDAYKSLLLHTPSWFIRILKFFSLLPKARVLNKEASIIDIDVMAEDRQGLIYDITKCIAERKMNIAKFSVYAVPPRDALYRIRLEVANFHEFSQLYDAILQVASVKSIVRRR